MVIDRICDVKKFASEKEEVGLGCEFHSKLSISFSWLPVQGSAESAYFLWQSLRLAHSSNRAPPAPDTVQIGVAIALRSALTDQQGKECCTVRRYEAMVVVVVFNSLSELSISQQRCCQFRWRGFQSIRISLSGCDILAM